MGKRGKERKKEKKERKEIASELTRDGGNEVKS